jgi:hypothetical protein
VANKATLICGGPDDFHWDFTSATESATVAAGASIQVLKNPGDTVAVPIAEAALPAYMTTDEGTRIFLVTGTLNAITALQEQFHP